MMLKEKIFCLSSFIVANMWLLNLFRGFGILFCSLIWRSISDATLPIKLANQYAQGLDSCPDSMCCN